MDKQLIVIACHGTPHYTNELLRSMRTNHNGSDVVVVDTCSDQPILSEVEVDQPFVVYTHRTDTRGYDTGAYISAFKRFRDYETFLFLQDSTKVVHPSFSDIFRCSENEYMPWMTHHVESDDKSRYVPNLIAEEISFPWRMIVGPIFSSHRSCLDEIDQKWGLDMFIPTSKSEAESMERGWPFLMILCGCSQNKEIISVQNNMTTKAAMDAHENPILTKVWSGRG